MTERITSQAEEISPYEKMRKSVIPELERLFESAHSPDEKYVALKQKLDPFFAAYVLVHGDDVALREATHVINREEFIAAVLDIIQPLIRMKIDEPEKFEKFIEERRRRESKYPRINDLLYYEMDSDGWVRLHVTGIKEQEKKLMELFVMLRQGLRKLAEIVHDQPEIKGIIGTSWIIAARPSMLKRLGFELEGEIDQETRSKHFADDPRPIHEARMSRKTLIEKWYQPKKIK